MKRFSERTYTDRIRWRIRGLWCTLIAMLVYMVVIAELGGGDSRIMTDLADGVSRLILFGGMAFVIWRIAFNKKLLRMRLARREQMLKEQDERNRRLHEKSGGTVLDLLLLCMLFATLTASLFDMAAFHTALSLLAAAVLLKAAAYFYYSKRL